MNLSYMNTESFKGMGKNFVLWWTWYYSVIRIFKTTFQNTRKIRKNKQEYLDAKNHFTKGLLEFRDRIKGKNYHGGDVPDDCDFYMYGLLKSKMNARTFENFVKKEGGYTVEKWIIKMSLLCKYENRYYANE